MQAGGIQARIEADLAGREPEVEVVLVEMIGGAKGSTIRLYIDHPDGVDHGLCARVTQHLRDWLDSYHLEVSSPGLDRPLSKPEHYRRFVGRRVRLRTSEPIDGKRRFTGEILDADNDGTFVATDSGTVAIKYQQIERSRLIAEFNK